jgi:hypothetical protein
MTVRLSALCAGRSLPPGRFLVLISVSDWVDPKAILRLAELVQLKNPVSSSGMDPATFRFLAYCFNQLRYRVLQIIWIWPNFASEFGVLVQVRWSPDSVPGTLAGCGSEWPVGTHSRGTSLPSPKTKDHSTWLFITALPWFRNAIVHSFRDVG